MITVKEAAERLEISEDAIYRSKKFKNYKYKQGNNRIMFDIDAYEDDIEKNEKIIRDAVDFIYDLDLTYKERVTLGQELSCAETNFINLGFGLPLAKKIHKYFDPENIDRKVRP